MKLKRLDVLKIELTNYPYYDPLPRLNGRDEESCKESCTLLFSGMKNLLKITILVPSGEHYRVAGYHRKDFA